MKTKIFFLILLLVIPVIVSGQKVSKKLTISGYVLDSNSKPVAGATIFVDFQRTNTTSNKKGFYKIKVSQAAKKISVLTASNNLEEAEIGDKRTINFLLKTAELSTQRQEQDAAADETVNIGYGTVKKKDLTTTVGKIDAKKKNYATYTDIYEMIRAGGVPGVIVRGKSILIQGPTSINYQGEPLFVVDGVIINSIENISPMDVESIEVLKGSAAAIYGSRGAAGVIMIYLKKAGSNRK
jgi:TonB-dependent starch-binding outer membrane protein SusC